MDNNGIIIEQFVLKHSKEAAVALEKFEAGELVDFFEECSVEVLLALVPNMNPQLILQVLKLMKEEKVIQVFESLEASLSVVFIRMMSKTEAEEILKKLSSEKALYIQRLLKYLTKSVGSYVDQAVFTLHENLTVKEALAQAKRHKTNLEPNLFVVTPERKLAGVIKLSDLITENPKKEIRAIMQTKLSIIEAETPINSIINHPGWKEFFVLPVVDHSRVLLGVIKLETIRTIQIKSDQSGEDIGKDTVKALSDLYQIGVAGLLGMVTELKSDTDYERQ